MEKTQQTKVLTNEEYLDKEKQAKVSDLFQEIVEVITDTFVATYEIECNSIIMRIVNGQKFRITVEEEK